LPGMRADTGVSPPPTGPSVSPLTGEIYRESGASSRGSRKIWVGSGWAASAFGSEW
ncbi:unnamed protein product, partial [Allacma fusca]